MTRSYITNCLTATPFIRGNPTVGCVNGNVEVLSSQDNVEKPESPIRFNYKDKETMKSVMRTIVRIVTANKRNWTATLKPKGTESDYNDSRCIVGNEQMVPGLQMASKVPIIICDIELGKLDMLPKTGRSSARKDDGIVGIGNGKKRRATCNELHRGSRFALTRKSADLLKVFHCMNGGKTDEYK